jgi:hypothetical protein
VIKEISAMTATQEEARVVAAAQALALAEVLGLGLPAPTYVAIYSVPATPAVSSVNLQFRGPHLADDVQAWADRFGTAAEVTPCSSEPGVVWVRAHFNFSGLLFQAYAEDRSALD